MAEREIVWTVTAEQQFQKILEYWLDKNKSSEYPTRILKLVDDHIADISNRPDSYRLTEYNNTSVCVIGVFNIYFKKKNDKVYITCFWDNRQDPHKLQKVLRRKRF
jgi:plasmid stabilization system protein ParE